MVQLPLQSWRNVSELSWNGGRGFSLKDGHVRASIAARTICRELASAAVLEIAVRVVPQRREGWRVRTFASFFGRKRVAPFVHDLRLGNFDQRAARPHLLSLQVALLFRHFLLWAGVR